MSESFDPLEASAQAARMSHNDRGPKLSFADRCSAFAALYQGTQASIVGKAFGLSSATVSYLGGCRPIDDRGPMTIEVEITREARGPDGQTLTLNPNRNGDEKPIIAMVTETLTKTLPLKNLNQRRNLIRKPRYQEVSTEFDRLGKTEFIKTYYTADVHERIMRLINDRPQPGDDRTPFSTNRQPTPFTHRGVTYTPDSTIPDAYGDHYRVALIDDAWRYHMANPDGSLKDGFSWAGDIQNNDKPFKNFAAAVRFILDVQ